MSEHLSPEEVTRDSTKPLLPLPGLFFILLPCNTARLTTSLPSALHGYSGLYAYLLLFWKASLLRCFGHPLEDGSWATLSKEHPLSSDTNQCLPGCTSMGQASHPPQPC